MFKHLHRQKLSQKLLVIHQFIHHQRIKFWSWWSLIPIEYSTRYPIFKVTIVEEANFPERTKKCSLTNNIGIRSKHLITSLVNVSSSVNTPRSNAFFHSLFRREMYAETDHNQLFSLLINSKCINDKHFVFE